VARDTICIVHNHLRASHGAGRTRSPVRAGSGSRRIENPAEADTVFDRFRQSLEDLLNGATPPEERRTIVSRMRETLVRAKAGVHELRDGVQASRARVAAEETELETVRRRKTLAEGIQDRDTVEIAARYEQMHMERVAIVRQKLAAQEAELALAAREVETMSEMLKTAVAGGGGAHAGVAGDGAPGAASLGSAFDDDATPGAASMRDELSAMARARARADRDADAERKLEELKRRMGK
jgi:hypothetical protein